MATGVVSGMPRPSTSSGLPRMNLPVIPHPSSRIGDRSRLSVRGESRQSIHRSNTFVSVDEAKLKLGRAKTDLPLLCGNERKEEKEVFRRSQPAEEGSEFYYMYRQQDPSKNRKNSNITTSYATDELEFIVAEKLTTSFHGLRHLFRSHDPTGQGNVSRAALLRILHNLVGYITGEQYRKFLHSLDLDGKDNISFDEFVSRFMTNESVPKEWLSPVHRKEMSLVKRDQDPEEMLRYGEAFPFHDGYNTSAYCFAKLKEKARYGNVDFTALLPESCLQPGGRMVPPQLQDLVEYFGMRLKDEDFIRLWERFDLRGTGTIKTTHFLKVLGLDELGKPRCYSSLVRSFRLDNNYRKTPYPTEEPTTDKAIEAGETDENNSSHKTEEQAKLVQLAKKTKTPVKSERIIHSLHYKFEEPFNSMLQGLQCFDFLGDGYIARIDFKRVLAEFKLPVQAVDLENFMSRIGIRTIRGQVRYKDVLNKFWNKSESGLVHRVVSNKAHVYHRSNGSFGTSLTAEELEAKLVEFFHGDFLKLANMCKAADKYGLGVMTAYEFKAAVEKILGYSVTDEQWTVLKSDVKLDSDGLVPYPSFLETFNASPGSWNHKDVGGFKVAQVPKAPTPQVVERLKVQSQECLQEIQQELEEGTEVSRSKKVTVQLPHTEFLPEKPEPRSVAQVEEVIGELLRYRFHTFDKAFKSLDRKMTGRFNRQQFWDMLKKCEVELSHEELDNLWNSLKVPPDGILSYSSLVQHFVTAKHEPPPIKNKLPMEDTAELLEDVKRFRRDKREQRLKAEREKETLYRSVKQQHHDSNTVTTQERDQIVNKIKHQVVFNWDELKSCFRNLDTAGSATVPANSMKGILHNLKFNLTENEVHKLLLSFDLNGDGQFHYMAFMQLYVSEQHSPERSNQPMYDRNSHRLYHKAKNLNTREKKRPCTVSSFDHEYLTVAQTLEKMRIKLLQDWKSLRRAFRKVDVNSCGFLTVTGFKQVLKDCEIHVSDDDLYHILSEFDEGLNGKVSYEQFLSQLLTSYA